jgi:hypothetical protein
VTAIPFGVHPSSEQGLQCWTSGKVPKGLLTGRGVLRSRHVRECDAQSKSWNHSTLK